MAGRVDATATEGFAALGRDLSAIADVELLTDLGTRDAYSADVFSRGVTCLAVVRPRTAEAVARTLELSGRAAIPVYPRGGGLTYSGGYLATDRAGIVLDTTALDRIVEVNPEDRYVTVESGVTWKQIDEALRPHGLRLPCFGTFSGAAATVGGGLSSGALFLGTARYGTVADSLLGLEVALPDGTLLRTGQAALRHVRRPAYRTYGPDLTGPFVHDCGWLGVKTRATFRLIRAPEHTGFASFELPTVEAAAAALSEVARAEVAEEAYVFDPPTTRNAFAGVDLRRAVRTLVGAARGRSGALSGMGRTARLALKHGPAGAAEGYSLHVVAAAHGPQALREHLEECRTIAGRHGATELPDIVPRGSRAGHFPPLNDILMANGDRWIALNAKVPHSEFGAVHAAVERILGELAEPLAEAGVRTKRMFIAIANHSFSYEPAFMWPDEWLPLHRRAPEPAHLAKFTEPPANPRARELICTARERLVQAFADLGAASNQIGRLYPYATSLDPRTRRFLLDIKRATDPEALLNPGVLGLRPTAGW